MGQAKVRKKNGTYPTPAEIVAMEREEMKWYPTADDLKLNAVPDTARESVREKLRPVLANMTHLGGRTQRVGIMRGKCFRNAQALVLTAKDPSIKYIEGMWGYGTAHAWVTVDGHRVDLTDERLQFLDGPKHTERYYEPFEEFSEQQLRNIIREYSGYDDATIRRYESRDDVISYSVVHDRWLNEDGEAEHRCHDFDGPGNYCPCPNPLNRSVTCRQWESCDCENDAAMKPALDRLKARIKQDKLSEQAVAA